MSLKFNVIIFVFCPSQGIKVTYCQIYKKIREKFKDIKKHEIHLLFNSLTLVFPFFLFMLEYL